MWIVALIFTALATFVAFANIYGCILASQNKRKGINKGYSNAPFLSLIFCIFAYFLGRDTLGLWVFIPALIDPGTLMTLYLPWIIWTQFLKPRFQK